MKKIIYISVALITVLVVYIFLSNAKEEEIYKPVANNTESCIQCHTDEKTGFSIYHNPKNIGCSACHLGNTKSHDKDSAHYEMIKIPGNLSDADKTCGKCHANQLHNIKHSLMTTNSGLIAVDKYFFKDSDSLDAYFHIKDLGYDASDTHLRNLCANCHLGAEKSEYGEINEQSRGGGCNACHLNYNGHDHPSTDIQITDTHCFGCHSRSSRISTNYLGYSESLLEELPDDDKHKQFEDGRIYEAMTEDVHHKAGLLCIDCHSSKEVMGHGVDYAHEEDAVKIQCSDCHTDEANTITYDELDSEEKMLFALRKYIHNDKKILATKKELFALINVYIDENNEINLISKKDNSKHIISKQNEQCSKSSHENLSCSSCHSSWTSKCIGCHNTFNRDDYIYGYDLLAKEATDESWNEMISEFSVSESALGVREKNGKKEIECAVPGMIMTIDHQSFDSSATILESFYRLYAPNAPHTTTKEVRSCKSCHNNSYAIGYGAGNLIFKNNKWNFTPEYENNEHDNLPEDAWIGMFEEIDKNKDYSTRTNFRPFNISEQKNILEVGKCLQCHKEDSEIMNRALDVGIWKVAKEKKDVCL